jgi:hypothetical protein
MSANSNSLSCADEKYVRFHKQYQRRFLKLNVMRDKSDITVRTLLTDTLEPKRVKAQLLVGALTGTQQRAKYIH